MLRLIRGNPSVNFICQSRKGNRATKLRRGKKASDPNFNSCIIENRNLQSEEAQLEIGLFITDNVQKLQLILRHKGA